MRPGQRHRIGRIHAFDGMPDDPVQGGVINLIGCIKAHGGEFVRPIPLLGIELGKRLGQLIERHLVSTLARYAGSATPRDWWVATALAVRGPPSNAAMP